MGKELLDYFNFDTNTPTVSAYTQQRAKVLPEAFEYLFKSFTAANNRNTHNYRGFKLIACDGSNLSIAYNPNDSDTSWVSNQYGDTANHLHLNAFYDVFNRIYLDVIIQTASEYQETRACVRMIERSDQRDVILVADRGYENYNIMAHADQKGWKYVIRVKDVNSNGIASALDLPLPVIDGCHRIRCLIICLPRVKTLTHCRLELPDLRSAMRITKLWLQISIDLSSLQKILRKYTS